MGFRTEAGFDGLQAKGVLWGGNLAMVVLDARHAALAASVKGGILFVEDVNEHPYRVERCLLQLHQAGVLGAQKAVLLGAVTEFTPSPLDRGYTLKTRDRAPAHRDANADAHRLAVRPRATKVTLSGRRAGRARWCRGATCSSVGDAVRAARLVAGVALATVLAVGLAACNNNPYPAELVASNTLIYTFDERSPRYLDPTASYSNPESAYTYQIYEAALRLPLPEAPLRARGRRRRPRW